jgi:hypothetical protein
MTVLHGSIVHLPFKQISPEGHMLHGLTHCPLLQNIGAVHITLKHGSGVHIGGLPVQICPVGQPCVLHELSTHAPSWHLKPVGHVTVAHGSEHTALPLLSMLQSWPAGQFLAAHASGMQMFFDGKQTKPPGHGNSPVEHGV